MVKVGCHVSIAGSIDRAVVRAEERGCDTFQIFTSNPRGWKAKPLEDGPVQRFREALEASGMGPAVAHMPYLPNLASPSPELYEKSCEVLRRELERCEALRIPYLVTHLGSHLGEGKKAGLERLAAAVSGALASAESETMLLLENTAGTKNSVGGSFEDISTIFEMAEDDSRLGICLDTCHAFAAGYDLRNATTVSETIKVFDSILGLKRLRVIHLNDSKGELGCRRDRHEHIGLGYIGNDGIRAVISHPRLRNLPFILETPSDSRRDDAGNIGVVRELAGE